MPEPGAPSSLGAIPKFILIVGIPFMSVASLWWYQGNYTREVPINYFDEDRNYAMLPFDMMDAQTICEAKTKLRYGDTLVRTNIDYHSTRFEVKSGLYKIFMSAQLGNIQIYDETLVHCFVNPQEYMVEHYRTFKLDQGSILERAKAIFFAH